jgi:hypothetical protein
LRRTIERRFGNFLVGNRDAEACAKRLHFFVIQLLLLMGDVLAFARLADAVPLDGACEDDRGDTLRFSGEFVGVVNLRGVVPAERELLQLFVRQVLDHLQQAGIGAPEVLPDVRARFDGVLLILAIDDLAHTTHQQSLGIFFEQVVPLGAPQHLDDIPARPTEDGLQLRDDLAVAAHRTVESLQVAIDDED